MLIKASIKKQNIKLDETTKLKKEDYLMNNQKVAELSKLLTIKVPLGYVFTAYVLKGRPTHVFFKDNYFLFVLGAKKNPFFFLNIVVSALKSCIL